MKVKVVAKEPNLRKLTKIVTVMLQHELARYP